MSMRRGSQFALAIALLLGCLRTKAFPGFMPDEAQDDLEREDGEFQNFFDEIIIPANKKRRELDPRIGVSKSNATEAARQCYGNEGLFLQLEPCTNPFLGDQSFLRRAKRCKQADS